MSKTVLARSQTAQADRCTVATRVRSRYHDLQLQKEETETWLHMLVARRHRDGRTIAERAELGSVAPGWWLRFWWGPSRTAISCVGSGSMSERPVDPCPREEVGLCNGSRR